MVNGSKISIKLALLGDAGVGKTSLRRRWMGESFKESHLPTIGVDFSVRIVSEEGMDVEFQIWDMSGQELFRPVRERFLAGSQAILYVYDVTNSLSLHRIKYWYQEAKDAIGEERFPNVCSLLIGNKIDLIADPSKTLSEAEEIAKELVTCKVKGEETEKSIFLTSALTGENVEEVFSYITKRMLKKIVLNKHASS